MLKPSALGLRGHCPIQAGFRHAAPAYTASAPNSSSIRISWLYFAVRSERQGAPVFIWPVQRATAKSAIVVSSVPPERWEHITPQPFCLQSFSIDGLGQTANLVYLQ